MRREGERNDNMMSGSRATWLSWAVAHIYCLVRYRRVLRDILACTGPTRPYTLSLHWLLAGGVIGEWLEVNRAGPCHWVWFYCGSLGLKKLAFMGGWGGHKPGVPLRLSLPLHAPCTTGSSEALFNLYHKEQRQLTCQNSKTKAQYR